MDDTKIQLFEEVAGTPPMVAPMAAEEVEWLREQIMLTAQGVLLAAIVFALMFAACALA